MDKKLLKKAEKLRDELLASAQTLGITILSPSKEGIAFCRILALRPLFAMRGVFIFIQAIFPRIFAALLPDRLCNFSLSPMRDARKISGRGFG